MFNFIRNVFGKRMISPVRDYYGNVLKDGDEVYFFRTKDRANAWWFGHKPGSKNRKVNGRVLAMANGLFSYRWFVEVEWANQEMVMVEVLPGRHRDIIFIDDFQYGK